MGDAGTRARLKVPGLALGRDHHGLQRLALLASRVSLGLC
jgi:hypothetical protein